MARNEYGKPFAGNDRMNVYNQMNRLVKQDEKPTAGEKKTAKKTKPEKSPPAWPTVMRVPASESFAPFAARALLGELSTDPSALALIQESTRFALIRALASPTL